MDFSSNIHTILPIAGLIIALLASTKFKFFPLIVFTAAWVLATASVLIDPAENRPFSSELIDYLVLLSIGIQGIWVFIGHCFCHKAAAKHMGWKPSEYQYQVGIANLALGILGIVSFAYATDEKWTAFEDATVLFACIYYLGSAIIHMRESVQNRNNQPGNSGPVLYTDIFVPATLIVCYFISAIEGYQLPWMN